MRRSSALYGLIGLVLIIFGLIDLKIAPGFRLFVWANLICGLFALVLWITSSRSALSGIVGQRSTRYGANAMVYTVAFVGVIVAINYLSTLHNRRLDLTAEKVYSLSSQSTQVVKNLKKPLKLIGFFAGGENERARELYSTYAYASPMLTYQLVDPDKHPELAERYKVSVMNTTHIQYGGDEKGAGTNVTDLTEEALTNAIIRATKNSKKLVYFLDGEGEGDIDDAQNSTGFGQLKTALEGEGYEVQKLVLAQAAKVPDDATMVVIAGPEKPLGQHEIDQLNAYLKRGGRVIATFRPSKPDGSVDEAALAAMAGAWGVKVDDDIVVDQVVRLFAGPALGLDPIVQNYGVHPITRGFKERTVFSMSRSLSIEPNLKPGLRAVALAKTSETSWGETDLKMLFEQQKAELDDKDTRGPVAVAAAVQGDLAQLGWGKGEARMVVFGSTDFIDNQHITNFFNRDFFVNSADWLAGEENSISIRPRSLRASRFRLTVDQFSIVFAFSVLLLPEALLILGIAVWWERRN
ncbi:MAG TPA: GldG family protein [Candidatus Binataceae bacterium]|nr:GldG family protein [Candidatus Binataceae bacterium]